MGNFQIPAIAKISAPACPARVVLAVVPADTYTLPVLEFGNTLAHLINDTRYFMSWNAGC
jgi:hypothetical protein